MDLGELRKLFIREGYRYLNGRPEEITTFYKYYREGFHVVVTIDMDGRYQISAEQHLIMEERVKSLFFHPQGNVPDFPDGFPVYHVEVLTLLVGGDRERIQQLCSQCADMWGYLVPEAQLLIYENQPGEFWGLRRVLEELQQPANGKKTVKGGIERRIRDGMPWMTISLTAVNILVFLFMELIGDTENGIFIAEHGGLYPEFIRNGNQWWRILTSGFIHFGVAHLMNNMVIFCCVGSRLERAVGPVRLLLIYLLSEAGGGFLSYRMMLHTGEYAVSAGASGAVFGTIAGLLWVVIFHKGRFEGLTVRGLIFMLVLSLYYGFSTIGVDNWSHIGGAAAGFISAVIFYHRKRQTG